MRETWDQRIARAQQLAEDDTAGGGMLRFYAGLLSAQKECHDRLLSAGQPPTGSLARDLPLIRPGMRPVLQTVARIGPEPLVLEADRLLAPDTSSLEAMLLEWWRAPSDRQFFAKAILQPYAVWLAEARVAPADRDLPRRFNACPFCGGAPQLAILHTSGESEGGGRSLLCATCLTGWPFRRLRCAGCGEEDERKLGYFRSPAFEHLRIDACETCHGYLKTIDLTRLGTAVPLVDEVAGAPLDAWARERGYDKIELNLVGL